MSHRPYVLAFNRGPDLVLHDHGIDTVPALHAAEGFDAVFAGVRQVIAPFVHEQAVATSARSRRELLARHEEPNGMSIPAFCRSSESYRFS
jgi:hypothetical protein